MSGGGSGVATTGFNLSYQFLPESPGIEPFVVGGVSFGSPAEFGLDGYTWPPRAPASIYWFSNGMALRVEACGRFEVEYDDHVVSIRVGLTF